MSLQTARGNIRSADPPGLDRPLLLACREAHVHRFAWSTKWRNWGMNKQPSNSLRENNAYALNPPCVSSVGKTEEGQAKETIRDWKHYWLQVIHHQRYFREGGGLAHNTGEFGAPPAMGLERFPAAVIHRAGRKTLIKMFSRLQPLDQRRHSVFIRQEELEVESRLQMMINPDAAYRKGIPEDERRLDIIAFRRAGRYFSIDGLNDVLLYQLDFVVFWCVVGIEFEMFNEGRLHRRW
ncbi:hypothetical protein B0H11DRAFT_1907218 [Mycena galericulata]|nr:hypothetical protein B0H11DRAFT_1907218 [Mycena galericulata]